MTRARGLLLLMPILLLMVGLVGACAADPTRGYSLRSTYDADVRSVGVPVFENRTYVRGLEVQVTEAVVKEIQRSTPWTVVPSERADTVLSGVITGTSLRPLSMGRRTGLVQEVAVRLAVDFEWRSNRTGEVLVSKRSCEAVETFVPAQGTGERIELGQTAAVQELAREIVAALRSNW